jgi:O-antigen/teichoic acid export membrane protein
MASYGSSIGRNTSYNLAAAVIPLLLSLFTIPLYLKLIGPDRFGVLAIVWLFLGYFGLFDLGLSRATAQRIAAQRHESQEARARTFWNAVAVNIGMGAVGAIALWVVARWYFAGKLDVDPALGPEVAAAIPLLALSVPVSTLTGVLIGALQGRERFLQTNLISTTSTILFQLLPLGVAWLYGPNLVWLLTAAIAARVLALLALWAGCKAEIAGNHAIDLSRKEMRRLLQFGGWITVSALVGPLMVMTDRFAIGAVMGAAAVAAYTIPFQLAQRTTVFPNAIANALFPRLSNDAHSEDAELLSRDAVRVAAALMTPAILLGIWLMGPFLRIWLGDALPAGSIIVGQIALVGWWLNGLAYMPFALIHARSKPRATAILHVAELVPYLALLYLLTLNFGLAGAATAFALRCGADYVALSVIAYGRRAGMGAVLLLSVLLIAAIYWTPMGLGVVPAVAAVIILALAIGASAVILPTKLRAKYWRIIKSKIAP